MKADTIVFAACCAFGMFALGLDFGQQAPEYQCPAVPGHEVISSISGPDGQSCMYARNYGRATKKVKL